MSSIGSRKRSRGGNNSSTTSSSDIDVYDSGCVTTQYNSDNDDDVDTSTGSGTASENEDHLSDIENKKKLLANLKNNTPELNRLVAERARSSQQYTVPVQQSYYTPPNSQPKPAQVLVLPPPPISLAQSQQYQIPKTGRSKKTLPGHKIRKVGNYLVNYNETDEVVGAGTSDEIAQELESIANMRNVNGMMEVIDERAAHCARLKEQMEAIQREYDSMVMANEHTRKTVTMSRSRVENIEDDFFTSWKQQVLDIAARIATLNDEHHRRAADPRGGTYPPDAVETVEKFIIKLDRAWNLSTIAIEQANSNNRMITLIDEIANQSNQADDPDYKQRVGRVLEARGVNMEHPYMTLMQRHFGIEMNDNRLVQPAELYEKFISTSTHLAILQVYVGTDLMKEAQFIEDRPKLGLLRVMVERCMGLAQNAYRCLMNYYNFTLLRTTRADEQTIIGTDFHIVRAIPRSVGMAREDRMDRLVEYTLDEACMLGFRISGGLDDSSPPILYRPMQTGGAKHYTQTFQPFTTLQEFIQSIFAKHVCNPDRYLDFTRSGTKPYESIFNTIRGKIDVRLPKLIKIRYCFAFEDGVFSAHSLQFRPYGHREGTGIPSHKACANYFPVYFENHPDIQAALRAFNECDPSTMTRKNYNERFMLIPTPEVDRILDNQEFSYEVKLWFWVMLGRLLFDTGSCDRWGIVPWFKGPAGTGKSTILERLIGGMYQAEDWYSLSTKTEASFGLSSYYKKFLVVAPEVKENFQLDSSDFQLMTMGEPIELRAKFMTAKKVLWTVSMAFGGNVVPRWDDQAGSIGRRVLAFQFSNTPDKEDGNLSFDKERGLIIRKAAHAYKYMLKKIEREKGSVWQFVPEYFLERRREFQSSTNSLVNFLQSGKLRYGPPRQVYMSSKKFMELYVNHCRQNNLVQQKWNEDNYYKPLLDAKCAFVITNKTNTHRIGKLAFPGWMPLPYPRPSRISSDLSPSPEWGGAVLSDSVIYGCDEYSSPIPDCQKTLPQSKRMNDDDDDAIDYLMENMNNSTDNNNNSATSSMGDRKQKLFLSSSYVIPEDAMIAPFGGIKVTDASKHFPTNLDADQDMENIIIRPTADIERIESRRKRRYARKSRLNARRAEMYRNDASLPNPESSVILPSGSDSYSSRSSRRKPRTSSDLDLSESQHLSDIQLPISKKSCISGSDANTGSESESDTTAIKKSPGMSDAELSEYFSDVPSLSIERIPPPPRIKFIREEYVM